MTRQQLATLGVTRAMVESRVASGHLVRLHWGVYAVGHRQLRADGISLAAVLAAGPGAVLSHRDAAGIHCLRPANHRLTDVTTERQRRPLAGVRLHRAALPPQEVTVRDGLPVTTVARTLVDLAGSVPRNHLTKAVHEAEHLRILDVTELERVMRRTRTRNGAGHRVLQAILDHLRAHGLQRTRSDLEIDFLALVEAHQLPQPQTNTHVHGVEVDAWWPDQRLAVECDGWQSHGTRKAFQQDRDKANHLTTQGITLLRFTHKDITENPRKVATHLTALLSGSRRQHPAGEDG